MLLLRKQRLTPSPDHGNHRRQALGPRVRVVLLEAEGSEEGQAGSGLGDDGAVHAEC